MFHLSQRRRLAFAAVVLVLWVSPGCFGQAKGPKRLAVSGTVTREGIPVDEGSIVFIPEGGPEISSGATIKDGKYAFTEENGLPAGKYKVQIVQVPLRDPNYVGKRVDAPLLEDNRFKNKMPIHGWTKEAVVAEDQQAPIDFHIDE